MSNNTDIPKVNLNLVSEDKEAQLHNYLGKIMLFPEDVQDKIIEEISMLTICSKEAITNILDYYTDIENNSSGINPATLLNRSSKK